MNILANALKNALGQDTVEKISAKSKAFAYFDFFANNRRRKGINPRTQKEYEDSHLQGRMTQPLALLKQAVTLAEQNGWDDVQIYVDLWFQHDGSGKGPMITGQARNVIPSDKRFVPQAQGTSQPSADATEAAPSEETVTA